MGNTGTISPQHALISEWSLQTFALVLVAPRFFVRQRTKRAFSPSDATILLASFSFTVIVVSDTVLVGRGYGYLTTASLFAVKPGPDGAPQSAFNVLTTHQLRTLLKWNYGTLLMYYISLSMIKITLVLLYYTLVPKALGRRYLYSLQVIAFVVVGSLVTALCLTLSSYTPVSSNWDLSCGASSLCYYYPHVNPYLVFLPVHVGTELMGFIYPLTLIRVLRFNKRQYREATMMFAVGFLRMAISLGRRVYFYVAPGLELLIGTAQILAAAEMSVGIVVCCMPALRYIIVSSRRQTPSGSLELRDGGKFPERVDIVERRRRGTISVALDGIPGHLGTAAVDLESHGKDVDDDVNSSMESDSERVYPNTDHAS